MLSDITLKTRIKQPAKPESNVNNFMLFNIALNTFVNKLMPTKKSNMCIVYH